MTLWGVTVANIRAMTDLSTSDISDGDVENLIMFAGSQFNAEVGVKIMEEPVEYIDIYRQNKIDGSNTVYFVKNSWDWYLTDLDDDGDLDISDIEIWSYDSSTDTRTQLTAATINERGYFTLSTAPSGVDLTVTYRYLPISLSNPLVKEAVTELTSAIAYRKIEAREFKNISLGGLSVSRKPIGQNTYMSFYRQTTAEINAAQLLRKQTAPIRIPEIEYLKQIEDLESGTGGEIT